MKTEPMQLPPKLLTSIADSECELVQWDGLQRTATVRITKDALPEVGLLHFAGVSFVHSILHGLLDEQAPELRAYLEATPDDELGLHYWDGPESN